MRQSYARAAFLPLPTDTVTDDDADDVVTRVGEVLSTGPGESAPVSAPRWARRDLQDLLEAEIGAPPPRTAPLPAAWAYDEDDIEDIVFEASSESEPDPVEDEPSWPGRGFVEDPEPVLAAAPPVDLDAGRRPLRQRRARLDVGSDYQSPAKAAQPKRRRHPEEAEAPAKGSKVWPVLLRAFLVLALIGGAGFGAIMGLRSAPEDAATNVASAADSRRAASADALDAIAAAQREVPVPPRSTARASLAAPAPTRQTALSRPATTDANQTVAERVRRQPERVARSLPAAGVLRPADNGDLSGMAASAFAESESPGAEGDGAIDDILTDDTPSVLAAREEAASPAPAAPRQRAAARSDDRPTETGVVRTAVNLRSGPDNDASVIKVLAEDSRVQVYSCKAWCEVSDGASRGFVYKSFIRR